MINCLVASFDILNRRVTMAPAACGGRRPAVRPPPRACSPVRGLLARQHHGRIGPARQGRRLGAPRAKSYRVANSVLPERISYLFSTRKKNLRIFHGWRFVLWPGSTNRMRKNGRSVHAGAERKQIRVGGKVSCQHM